MAMLHRVYVLGSHLWVEYICLNIICIQYDRVQKKKKKTQEKTSKQKQNTKTNKETKNQ